MSSSQPQPTVHPPCGPIQGRRCPSVLRFTSIPYGTASRFQPPQAHPDWTETLEATKPAPACPQPPEPKYHLCMAKPPLEGLTTDESCLFMSVITPITATPSSNLPVIVWIHGGGFINGAADSLIHDPTQLASENNVIVVNIQYRLGLLGFLGDGSSRPPNLGLMDQIAALRWIRRNISAFGGNDNPKNITVMGMSAGGISVADLMATADAEQLFGRAIVQSAPFAIIRGRAKMNEELCKEAGGITTTSSVDEVMQAMQNVFAAGRKYGIPGAVPIWTQYGFAPLPDEEKLDETLDAVAPKIDLLIGCTQDEIAGFTGEMFWVETMAKIPIVGPMLYRAFVAYMSGWLYHGCTRAFAERHARAGGKVSLYRLTWAAKGNRMGANHAIELTLLFGEEDTWMGGKVLEGFTWQQIEQDGKKFRKLWADFAKGRQLDDEDSLPGIVSVENVTA